MRLTNVVNSHKPGETMIRQLTLAEASELDDRISPHWHTGKMLVFKVCGYDRVGMIHKYLYDYYEKKVTIQFLMIDTLLKQLDGSSAWMITAPSEEMRKVESWDILSIKPLMFPPN